ncbi:hypothetical protein CYMTET_18625, partial [Cymbomonas tetramitiformis]
VDFCEEKIATSATNSQSSVRQRSHSKDEDNHVWRTESCVGFQDTLESMAQWRYVAEEVIQSGKSSSRAEEYINFISKTVEARKAHREKRLKKKMERRSKRQLFPSKSRNVRKNSKEFVKGAGSQGETENPLATFDITDPWGEDVKLPVMSDPAVTGGDLAHEMSVDLAPAAESPSKKAAVIRAGATYRVTAVFEESLVWHLAVHLTDCVLQEHATQRAGKRRGKHFGCFPSISRGSNPNQFNSTRPVPVRYSDREDENNGENNGDGKDENNGYEGFGSVLVTTQLPDPAPTSPLEGLYAGVRVQQPHTWDFVSLPVKEVMVLGSLEVQEVVVLEDPEAREVQAVIQDKASRSIQLLAHVDVTEEELAMATSTGTPTPTGQCLGSPEYDALC